ncbi:MAG: hypothetical protein WCA10_15225 [Terracidiphilus sp.]
MPKTGAYKGPLVITVGVTGHQRLKNSNDWIWVRNELESSLAGFSRPWLGISSLAIGTDQLFAELVLESGNPLKVVVPNEEYHKSFHTGPEREHYLKILNQATEVVTLTGASSAEESYLRAGKMVVDESDLILAVWDGRPSKGLGGTGDIVAYAISSRKKVIHLNPISHSHEKK